MVTRTFVSIALVSLAVGFGCSKAPSKSKNNDATNNGTNNDATNNSGTNNDAQNSELGLRIGQPGANAKLDLLMVVDNTGSMCQEQRILRENFDRLLTRIDEAGIDFHIGITTTDMNPEYALEPVAQPGYLQSTPQPVPGFDRSCHTAVDSTGQPIQGDYTPIRETIAAAVNCMEVPDDSYNNISTADIECGLYNSPQGCSIARADCGGGGPCTAEDLFPPPGSYRNLPKVFRSADYTNGVSLDVEKLRADFACASLVGTRGYGIEKGLAAAVQAVDSELTGGVEGSPNAVPSAPNHGLIREGARFGLAFITDENDCSHDGTLDEGTACGGDVCEFANKEGDTDSPLIAPLDLKSELIDNLRNTKADGSFSDSDVFVASIHGNSDRFDGNVPSDAECGEADYEGIEPSCASSLGIAFSGDRYERFLRTFPEGNYYPQEDSDPETALTGWMCAGDYQPALEALGEFFSATDSCIVTDLASCSEGSSCPDDPYTEQEGSCVPRGDRSFFCDSQLQLRAVALDEDTYGNLGSTGYCVEGTLGTEELPNGCVVSRDKWFLETCTTGGSSGLEVSWVDLNEARNAFLGQFEFYIFEAD